MVSMSNSRDVIPRGVPSLFGGVFVLWVLGYGLGLGGTEPFPALIQPGFGYVAEADGTVEWIDLRYTATLADGRTVEVDPSDLFPDAGGKVDVMAHRLAQHSGFDDPESVAWLRGRLDDLGHRDAVQLTVTKVEQSIDTAGGDRTQGRTKMLAVVDLR